MKKQNTKNKRQATLCKINLDPGISIKTNALHNIYLCTTTPEVEDTQL